MIHWKAIIVVALLALWLYSSTATPKATGAVTLGAGDVQFKPSGGEWNPYYVKQSSVDLQSNTDDSAPPIIVDQLPSPAMADLIDQSSIAIKNYERDHPDTYAAGGSAAVPPGAN